MGGQKLTIRDDLGDELTLDAPPRRIVSLVPSVTETLIELGAGDRLVGITTYCVHPRDVVDKIPRVGGTKGFSLEKIDAVRPDLVIANKEENRQEHVEALRQKYTVFVTYPRTIEQAVDMVANLGRLTAQEENAAQFAAGCDRILNTADLSVIGPALPTVCMIWRDPWMAVGPDSYVSDLLDRFGFKNVFARQDGRYPKTTLHTVLERGSELIILPDEPYAFGESDKEEVESFVSDCGYRARVLLMDGSYLTWFGTRTLRALQRLYSTKADLTLGPR